MPDTREPAFRRAYFDGRRAQSDGQPLNANPHVAPGRRHWWNLGWHGTGSEEDE